MQGYPSLYKMGARSRNHAGGVAPLLFTAQIEDAPKFPSPKFKDCTKLVAIDMNGFVVTSLDFSAIFH